MRHSTQEEMDDYEAMLKRKSTALAASEEFERIKAENAKLRKLVETMCVDMCEMLYIMDRSSDTRGYCRYYGECLGAAEDIMRELGIEVGE